MPTRVHYADDIEPLVQLIEETDPSEIVDRTLAKLRAGVSTQTMLTASALAVTRSADLPPGHHGGPLHPLAGLHAVSHLVDRLEGESGSPGAATCGACQQTYSPTANGTVYAHGVRAAGCRRASRRPSRPS